MMKRRTVIFATLMIGLPWTCFVGTLAAAEKPVAPATTKSTGKRVFFTGPIPLSEICFGPTPEDQAFQDYKKENPDWRGTLESQ